MNVNFEEKTFEYYLNYELELRGGVVFPFGQVQEGSIGADAAAHIKTRELAVLIGLLPLAIKKGEDIGRLVKYANPLVDSRFPTLRANVLFQYKRPYYITTGRGKEYSEWSKPYYRYRIDKPTGQLDKLFRVDHHFSGVTAIYAAPAIHEATALVEAHNVKNIIENTNFVLASKLREHSCVTYATAGRISKAHSNVDKIEQLN
ncbi:MAG: hypothetical protein LBT52_00565, partial [Clostridiales Family XIII bacterium]|nr:hypothetical protein [Clostridiales Family XIII bacterium]